MNAPFLLYLWIFLLLTGCGWQAKQEAEEAKLQAVQAQLVAEEARMETEALLVMTPGQQGQLMHVVALTLKKGISETDKSEVIASLKSLSSVQGVKGLHVGTVEDTGDARAAKGYDLVLSMAFEGEEALATYQQNPFHLEVRKGLGPFLGGPPLVYDYVVQ